MQKKLMPIIKTALLILPMLLGASCSKDNPDYDDDEVIIEGDYREPASISDGKKIAYPAYIAPSLSEEFSAAVKDRVKETASSLGNASVVITDSNGYAALDSIKNRVVIIYRPTATLLGQLGLESGDFLCVAIQQGRSGNCAVQTPPEGLDASECLNGLVAWTNNAILNSTGNFDESSFLEESSLNTTFSGHLKEQITSVLWSKHDYLEGNYSVDVQVKVNPLHGFGQNGFEATDYYLVTSSVSVASGKMYSGNFTKMHGRVKARICGFYLRSLSTDISIEDSSKKTVGRFVQVPTPESVIGSTTYTTGWNFSVGGGITGGTSPMLSLTTGYSTSSSTSRAINDCDVVNRHKGNTVGYDYTINGLPHYKSVKITDPPLVSTSTITFYSQWVWAVPTNDYDVSTQYRVRINLSNLVYGASYFYSTEADYHDLEFPIDDESVLLNLPVPNRSPTGKLELTNDVDGTFLTNVKLTNKTYPWTGFYNDTSIYGYGNSCSMYLVNGDYDLKCDIKDNSGSTQTHQYTGTIKVTTGGTVKLSTSHGF